MNWLSRGLCPLPAGLLLIGWVSGVSFSSAGAEPDHLSLAGRWRFELDRADSGVQQRWFGRKLNGALNLPGSLPEQGIGDPVSIATQWTGEIVDKSWFNAPQYARYREPGNVKIPFWLQPDTYYAGVAWYQRDIEIPADWATKRVVLSLERPHWETRVWIDDTFLGTNDSLSTPHEYELGSRLTPGRHRLTVRVDNRLVVDVGVNSHSISDHTQGNWNGVAGRIELRTTPQVWLEEVRLFPADIDGEFRVLARIGNANGTAGSGTLSVRYEGSSGGESSGRALAEQRAQWSETGGVVECRCKLPRGAAWAWDEFRPTLNPLLVQLSTGDAKSISYGSRQISTSGTQFLINGQKTFIRGTLECCIFPKTGYPPTDLDSWRRIVRIAKAHGLNLIRFHSWCPPEAAFCAADELGFYYQVEVASWANSSSSLGDGKPVDQWLYREAERIIKAYGNHPSFLLMPYGNEPGGAHHAEFLSKWVSYWKTTDPRRLYTSASGWPQLSENQFHVTPDPRIQAWGEGLKSRINALPPETCTDYREYIQKRSVPVISHEIGQWCVYPNFAEIPKYTGYLKPKNFEIFKDSLTAHGMASQAHAFLMASGKLQTLCYKEEIESSLRTPGMGGFELLDLHDFPGQGTALVGVLDPFWEDKGYVTVEEFRRFCNSTVPLARLKKRVFTTDETLEAKIEVAHFGAAALEDASVTWQLMTEKGGTAAEGEFARCPIPLGNGTALGSIKAALSTLPAPAKYSLGVQIASSRGNGTSSRFANDWDVWVYPARSEGGEWSQIKVVHELDETTERALNGGAKILLEIAPDRVRGDEHGRVALGFSSIFWNTAWTGRQAPHTLGILCNPKAGALAEFPTEYHSNWQWWYLVSQAGAMILDPLPVDLHPTVQVVDDWVTNRKLGLVFEVAVGEGKLLVCSIDLEKQLDQNPVARQMRKSLLDYMASSMFNPSVHVRSEQIRRLMN